jgi:hypothetical protein
MRDFLLVLFSKGVRLEPDPLYTHSTIYHLFFFSSTPTAMPFVLLFNEINFVNENAQKM